MHFFFHDIIILRDVLIFFFSYIYQPSCYLLHLHRLIRIRIKIKKRICNETFDVIDYLSLYSFSFIFDKHFTLYTEQNY